MDQIWFYCKPLGKNAITDFMCKAKELLQKKESRKISNHSARKTTITNLLKGKLIIPLHVQQVRGHKNSPTISHLILTLHVKLQKNSPVLFLCFGSCSSAPIGTDCAMPRSIQQQMMQLESHSTSTETKLESDCTHF